LSSIAALSRSALAPGSASACVNAATAKSFQGQANAYMALSATGTRAGCRGIGDRVAARRGGQPASDLTHKTIGKAEPYFSAAK
jgi:hypothetical protein